MIQKAKIKSQNVKRERKIHEDKINSILEQSSNIVIKVPEKKSLKNVILNCDNYAPSKFLSEEVSKDNLHVSIFLNKLTLMNSVLSELLVKKKINIRDIEIKLKNEELRKEKEALLIRQNLEEKLESVLDKANSCLENIKKLGKKTNISKSGPSVEKKINNGILLEKTNPSHSDLPSIVKNLGQKYNENISVNRENMDFYFSLIAKNRKTIKDLKERSKRQKIKLKGIKEVFKSIYSYSYKKNKNKEDSAKTISSFMYKRLDTKIQALSLVNTSLFEKLHLKILYENDFNKQSTEDDVYDIFSFWYYLKNIKNILSNKTDSEINNYRFPVVKAYAFGHTNPDQTPKNIFIKKFIINNLKSFYSSLYKEKKVNEESELKEEEIFDKEFYIFYDSLVKIYKIKYMKTVIHSLSQIQLNINTLSITNQQKEQLLYLKSIYSLIVNNGNFSYQISRK